MPAAASKVVWLSAARPASIRLAVDDAREEYGRQFGGNLVSLRIQAGISSQPKLAELVGVSTSTVQRWEAGAGLPDAWELRRLVQILAATLEELVEPEPLSERERLLLRRAGRAVRRGVARGR